jgi:predicted Zn-dependent protease
LCSLLSGCGSGGGTAAAPAIVSSNASSDNTPNLPVANSSPTAAGCTTAFTPNYSNLMPLYRWASLPVKVRFLNSGVVTLNDGTQADLQQVAMDGFGEWATATNNTVFVEITTDPAQANITVHFGGLPGVPTANSVLGLEQSTLYSDNTIKSADILLNTWPSMTSANVNSFRETSTHEFGHALGINGHSDSPQDVMYAAHSIVLAKPLSIRDIDTLRTAYCNDFSREVIPHVTAKTRIETNY